MLITHGALDPDLMHGFRGICWRLSMKVGDLIWGLSAGGPLDSIGVLIKRLGDNGKTNFWSAWVCGDIVIMDERYIELVR